MWKSTNRAGNSALLFIYFEPNKKYFSYQSTGDIDALTKDGQAWPLGRRLLWTNTWNQNCLTDSKRMSSNYSDCTTAAFSFSTQRKQGAAQQELNQTKWRWGQKGEEGAADPLKQPGAGWWWWWCNGWSCSLFYILYGIKLNKLLVSLYHFWRKPFNPHQASLSYLISYRCRLHFHCKIKIEKTQLRERTLFIEWNGKINDCRV